MDFGFKKRQMKRIFLVMALVLGVFCAKAQTPTDSVGVYMVRGNDITPMSVINYDATKISKGFMSAKAKLEFAGATSQNQFNGSAKFRIYFGQPPVNEMANLYMFMPNYKISDFGIGQFEVKKNKRLLTTANAAVFGSSGSGAKSSDNVSMEITELRPNAYEVTITGAPGEYCIMHTFRGSGGFGGVFDFTILP